MGIAHWRLWDHFLQSIAAQTTRIGYIENSETDCAMRQVSYDPMHAANSAMLLHGFFSIYLVEIGVGVYWIG